MCLVADEVGFGLRHLRLVAFHRRFRLVQSFVVRTRVDAEQQVAPFDVLAFGETDGIELAGDLGLHLHDGGSLHRPDYPHFGGHGLLGGFVHRHRHGRWSGGRTARRLLFLAAAGHKET